MEGGLLINNVAHSVGPTLSDAASTDNDAGHREHIDKKKLARPDEDKTFIGTEAEEGTHLQAGVEEEGNDEEIPHKDKQLQRAANADENETFIEIGADSSLHQREGRDADAVGQRAPDNNLEDGSDDGNGGKVIKRDENDDASGEDNEEDTGQKEPGTKGSKGKKFVAGYQLEPFFRYKWLPSRRARTNTIQRMEIQKLQHEFEEKDFAEMEREETAKAKPKKDKKRHKKAGAGSDGETIDGNAKKSHHRKKEKKEEQVKERRRTGLSISKLEERLAQQGDKPMPTVSVDPVTGEKRRLLKCTLCMAYNSLKVCTKGMCSRCCPVGGNPCEAHSQRQKRMLDIQMEGDNVAVSGISASPAENNTETTRKNKKRKSTDAESQKRTPLGADGDKSSKKRRKEDSPSSLPLAEGVDWRKDTSDGSEKNVEAAEVHEETGSSANAVLTADSLDASDDPNSVLQKKCSRCHSNNYLKLCPKEMCRVCCPKDGEPCKSHIFQETLKKNAEISKTRREQERRPVKLDKNGRRIPLKCRVCTAYNAMKDCARDLCAVCCKKDPRGLCEAHAFVLNKAQNVPPQAHDTVSISTTSGSPRNYTDRRKKLKKLIKPESAAGSEEDGSHVIEKLEGAETRKIAGEDLTSKPAKRRWTEMAKAEGMEKRICQPSGDTISSKADVIVNKVSDSPRRRTPARCADCNSNNALRICAKGMCSLCCPKDGNLCPAHSKRQLQPENPEKEEKATAAAGTITKAEEEVPPRGEADRMRPIKKRLFYEEPKSPISEPESSWNAHNSGLSNGSLDHADTNTRPQKYHALKCVACNSYNMLKSCTNSMCSICCCRSQRGPCPSHMKRTNDPGGERPAKGSRMRINLSALPSRRAKQNTLAKMRLQQLQDEFDSIDDEGEFGGIGSSDSLSEDSESESEEELPRVVSKTIHKEVPQVVILPPAEAEERSVDFTEYDLGSDYEQEFVDDLQFITCEKWPDENSANKRQKIRANGQSTLRDNEAVSSPRVPSKAAVTQAVSPSTRTGDLRCANCKTTQSSMWRDGWTPEASAMPVNLCNDCGIRYKKDMFCSYCNYIYMADEDWETTKWIGCDMCNKWIHRRCEEKRLGFSIDQSDLYLCPNCRARHSSRTTSEVLNEKRKRDEARRRRRKLRKKQQRELHANAQEAVLGV